MTQSTAKFQNLSRLILELGSRAESDECRDKTLANIIKKVQTLEEKKLHLTVDHQLALQQAQDSPDDELVNKLNQPHYDDSIRKLVRRMICIGLRDIAPEGWLG